jgi:hypothetical protein
MFATRLPNVDLPQPGIPIKIKLLRAGRRFLPFRFLPRRRFRSGLSFTTDFLSGEISSF